MKRLKTNRKMHIAFIDFDDIKNPLLSGGQARATFEVAKRLVAMGNEVTIICSRFPASRDQVYQGINYKHIGLGSGDIRLNNLAFFLALPFALFNFKADVIIECFTAPISTSFAPIFTRIPVIGMPTMFEAEQFAKKYHLPFDKIEKFGAKFYKYFLAYSPINKRKMLKLNPKIHWKLIPNGISEDSFTKKVSDKGYVLYIGRIDIVQKGLDLLIEAFSKAQKEMDINLVIAGNGPASEEKKLKELISKFEVANRVKFVGRADGSKKEKLLREATFGVYPSRFEDFPLVPLEYTSFSKPVVCFDIEGLAWVTADVSLKAKPFDVSQLSKALSSMATSTALRQKLAKASRPFARQYGWNTIARQYEEYCAEVVELDSKRRAEVKDYKLQVSDAK